MLAPWHRQPFAGHSLLTILGNSLPKVYLVSSGCSLHQHTALFDLRHSASFNTALFDSNTVLHHLSFRTLAELGSLRCTQRGQLLLVQVLQYLKTLDRCHCWQKTAWLTRPLLLDPCHCRHSQVMLSTTKMRPRAQPTHKCAFQA